MAAGTLLTSIAATSAVALGAPAAHAIDAEDVEVVAHRGGSDWGTENSVKTVKRALERGADSVEVDVQWTKDNRTVIMHDKTMNRTSNCSGTVTKITYKKFRSCKLNDGTTAPHIYEMIEEVHDQGKHIFLHPRDLTTQARAKKIIRALEKFGMNNRHDATIISTNKQYLDLAKKYGFKGRRGYLFSSEKGWSANYSILLPYDTPVTESRVERAQRNGHKVMVVESHPTKLSDVLHLDLDGFLANGLTNALIKLEHALFEVTKQLTKIG
jgi:glycerophosphoryl diester phosphodiesterase